MVYGTYNLYSNYTIPGVFVNQRSHHWGAPSCIVGSGELNLGLVTGAVRPRLIYIGASLA